MNMYSKSSSPICKTLQHGWCLIVYRKETIEILAWRDGIDEPAPAGRKAGPEVGVKRPGPWPIGRLSARVDEFQCPHWVFLMPDQGLTACVFQG